MCLSIIEGARLRTAGKDITVWKHVRNVVDIPFRGSTYTGMLTPYYGMPVAVGWTYKSNLVRKVNEFGTHHITEGLHSFASRGHAKKDMLAEERSNYRSYGYSLIECVIPKGAKYYAGTFVKSACYASDAITYVRKVER